MLRTTACLALLLVLPVAAQDLMIALPLSGLSDPPVQHKTIAGGYVGFELEAPDAGEWMMVGALTDDAGNVDPSSVALIWRSTFPGPTEAQRGSILPDYLAGLNFAFLGMYQTSDGQALFTAIHQLEVRHPTQS